MDIDFNNITDRRASESAKWNKYDEDVLPMWVADMDFRSPQPVIDAMKARLDHGILGYPEQSENLKISVVEWLGQRHGWKVFPEDLVFVPGVVTGFNLAAHAVTRPGDGVLVQTPTYGPLLGVDNNAFIQQQEMELTQDNNGRYIADMDAFEEALTGRTRIFMLCNPQNPTGRVFQKNELEDMAEICLKSDIVICSDEIHSDLVFSGNKHIPIANLDPEISAKTITLIAPSKTFNIAGLKASIAVITDENLRNQFKEARIGLAGSVNLLGMVAMEAAYRYGEAWLEALLGYLEINRNYVSEFIENELPGIKMTKPEGTYLAWLDCREVGINGNPDEFFIEKAKIAMNQGNWFGNGGQGFVRLNFGCPRSILEESLFRMKTAINQL